VWRLECAVFNDGTQTVRQLLPHHPEAFNPGPNTQGTAERALNAKASKSLCYLLRHGADPNCVSNHKTLLARAVRQNVLSAVKRLLKHGADPTTIESRYEQALLSVAALHGCSRTVKTFLNHYKQARNLPTVETLTETPPSRVPVRTTNPLHHDDQDLTTA